MFFVSKISVAHQKTKTIKNFIFIIVIFIYSVFFSSCQSIFDTNILVSMNIKNDSNKNIAFENDIVAISSSDIIDKIENTTNKDWFNDSLNEYKEIKKSNKIKIYKTYIIPEEHKKIIKIKIPKNCKNLYIFNKYISQINSYPIKLNFEKNIYIIFNKDEIEIKTSEQINEINASNNNEKSTI